MSGDDDAKVAQPAPVHLPEETLSAPNAATALMPGFQLGAPNVAPAFRPLPAPSVQVTDFDRATVSAALTPAPTPAPPPPLALRHKLWVYGDTMWQTAFDSLLKPVFWGGVGAAASFVALFFVFGLHEVGAAFSTGSLSALATDNMRRLIALSAAIGALCVALWSLKDYTFDAKGFLLTSLARHVPKAKERFAHTPVSYLRFYHRVLRRAGAFAFLCEIVFQILAFGIVTWGVATAMPDLHVFVNQADVTLPNALLFWVERVFALIDGPQVFGLVPPVEPNTRAWGFGLAIIFFKIGVIGLCINLFQTSLALKPGDISDAWGAAVAGHRDNS